MNLEIWYVVWVSLDVALMVIKREDDNQQCEFKEQPIINWKVERQSFAIQFPKKERWKLEING